MQCNCCGDVLEWKNWTVKGTNRLMSWHEQTVLMALCITTFSNQQHSLQLIRKEWPPCWISTYPHRLAHQPVSPFISHESFLSLHCPMLCVPEANLQEGTDVKNQMKCVWGPSRDQTKTPSVNSHTHGLGVVAQKCTHRERGRRDARWLIMSTCSGVVIFKMSVGHVFVLPHVIFTSFILNSKYMGVSTVSLMGE